MAEDETTYLLKRDAMRKRLLAALARQEEPLPPELERQIAELAAADDETLWQMVRGQFSKAKAERSEALHLQRQAGKWNETLAQEAEQLATEMEQYMFLHAQAMSLLMPARA